MILPLAPGLLRVGLASAVVISRDGELLGRHTKNQLDPSLVLVDIDPSRATRRLACRYEPSSYASADE